MNNEIPFQVEHLIKSLLDGKENIHIRGNYRHRLVSIRDAVDKAIRKYDNDLQSSNRKRA